MDASCWLSLPCVSALRDAEDISFAVETLVDTSALFARRSGGQLPILDASDVNSAGVQISSANVNLLVLQNIRRWFQLARIQDKVICLNPRMAPI